MVKIFSSFQSEENISGHEINQFNKNITDLINSGAYPDKIEIIIIGNLLDEYSFKDRKNFIRNIYYASNVFFDRKNVKNLRNTNRIFYKNSMKIQILN